MILDDETEWWFKTIEISESWVFHNALYYHLWHSIILDDPGILIFVYALLYFPLNRNNCLKMLFFFQSYEKQGFHSGTPPPFTGTVHGSQNAGLAPSGTGYAPQMFIQTMAPHQQHHSHSTPLMHQPLHQVRFHFLYSSTVFINLNANNQQYYFIVDDVTPSSVQL